MISRDPFQPLQFCNSVILQPPEESAANTTVWQHLSGDKVPSPSHMFQQNRWTNLTSLFTRLKIKIKIKKKKKQLKKINLRQAGV